MNTSPKHTRNCLKCGQALATTAGFCRNCGTRVELPPTRQSEGSRKAILITALIGLVVAGGIAAAVVALGKDDAEPTESTPHGGGDSERISPATCSSVPPKGLFKLADAANYPVYWAGPIPNTELELTPPTDGNAYVRYLTGDAEADDPRAEYLTIGTYPVVDAQQALRDAANTTERDSMLWPEAGYEVLGSAEETSAYMVFDDQPDLQIEIYDPTPKRAFSLARSGRICPVPPA
ncbi:MAG: hypothetical protein WD827_01485 [Solirubrobacterales bacterium]